MKNFFSGILGRKMFVCLFLLSAALPLKASGQDTHSASTTSVRSAVRKTWADNDPRGHTIYFYDKEMRNGAVTTHMWHRDPVYGDDGTTVTEVKDSPLYEWENRKTMEFTGKKIEIDGEYYPVYRQDFYCYSYLADNYSADWNTAWVEPTHILLQHEDSDSSKNEVTEDLEFVDNALYGFDGVRIENFDESSLVDVTDDDYKKYVIYVTGDTNKFYYIFNNLRDYIRVHVWGPDGDLSPWAFNGSCSILEENPSITYTSYQVWTEQFAYSPVIKYEFYYRGATPTNLIIKYRRFADDWDRATSDLTFVDGALYTLDEAGHYYDPIENPEITDQLPVFTGDFYIIDTDCFYEYEYNETTGKYRLTTTANGTPTFERSPVVGYSGSFITTINTEDVDVKYARLGNGYYPVIKVSLGNSWMGVEGKYLKDQAEHEPQLY